MEEVEVAGEDGGEADGGAWGDVDCDEGEFDFVVYGKEHSRLSGDVRSLVRCCAVDATMVVYINDNSTTTSCRERREGGGRRG